MKILMASAYCALMKGGGEHYTMEVARSLSALGEEPTIMTGRDPFSQHDPIADDIDTIYVGQFFGLRDLSMKGIKGIGGLAWNLHMMQYATSCYWKMAMSEGYDIIQTHDPASLRGVAWYDPDRPIVSVLHGPPSRRDMRYLRKADHIIPVNETIASNLRKEGYDDVTVISPGVDTERFRPMSREGTGGSIDKDDRFTLLYVGRLMPVKNLTTLMDAIGSLKRRGRNISLMIIGDGPLRSDLEAYSSKIGIEVRFEGGVRNERLREYYCACDAFILPSIYESFSMVALEAASCGAPLLISEGAADFLRSFGRDDVVTFDPTDIEDMASSIERMIDADRASISISMRDRAERNDWGSRARMMKDIMEDLL